MIKYFKSLKMYQVKAMLLTALTVLCVSSLAYATDSVDFSTVVSTVLGYLTAAFTAAATLLALLYGAPLAWRFVKRMAH